MLALGLILIMIATRVFAAPNIDLSSVNQYNQISFGDADLENSYAFGSVAYGGNARFDTVSLSTQSSNIPCPSGNTVVEVAGNVEYIDGKIFGGSGRHGGTLNQGSQTFDCNQDNWVQAPPTVNFAAIQTELTNLSSDLANATVTGPLKIGDCFVDATKTNSDLNVYNIDASIFENPDPNRTCTFVIDASCSATILINISGTTIDLNNFNLTLAGGALSPSRVLVNFYEAQTINFNNVQIGGTVLAPLATVNGAVSNAFLNRIIGGLYAAELNGQFNSELAPFVAGPQSGCELAYDFGDLPDQYSVNLLENGARHEIGSLFLGNTIDQEPDGQPSPGADGDASDEDGIVADPSTWTSNTVGGGNISTFASGAGCLNGWLDWNNDGDFDDADEHIIINTAVDAVGKQISFDVQYVPMGSIRYARYRLTEQIFVNGQASCDYEVSPTGFYKNGEVEDYQYIFADATAVTLTSAETAPATASLILSLALALGLTTVTFVRRKEA